MAIFHLSAKIVARESGRTALGAAAYRSGETLVQDGIGGVTHDYSRKDGVVHTQIMAPSHAPEWVYDRSRLWNEVDRMERRKDAQLAREIEVALPVEMRFGEQMELLQSFVSREIVSRGMVADIAVHHDNPKNPHAHILLTLREIGPDGFGLKQRDWNRRELVSVWRESWAAHVNEALAMGGHDARVDHRSHAERGLSMTPGVKIGAGLERRVAEDLPTYIAERIETQKEISRENGERIIADPGRALEALVHHQATFSERDIRRFLETRTDGPEQFQKALEKVLSSPELFNLNAAQYGEGRYSTVAMIQLERQVLGDAEALHARQGHHVGPLRAAAAAQGGGLTADQSKALRHVLADGDLKLVMGVAGAGKSTVLGIAREAWESQGYRVSGVALSGIAAEGLQRSSGMPARTLASLEHAWTKGHDRLGPKDILIVDEAAMVGTRQLAAFVSEARQSGAKLVLLGDVEQLQAIEAGAPFRGILSTVGATQLEEVRRQNELWQRSATRDFFTGATAQALSAYGERGYLRMHATSGEARTAMLASWARAVSEGASVLMLAHSRKDVQELNELVRDMRKGRGELGDGVIVETERGQREMAVGERIYFLRNEKSLGVKNGTLAEVTGFEKHTVTVRTIDPEPREIQFDSRQYRHLEYGYAATIHKSQGATVDRTLVLASPGMDRHLTYVAMSRHRDTAELHYSQDKFSSRTALVDSLSRARPKDLASDYIGRDVELPAQEKPSLVSRFRELIDQSHERARLSGNERQRDPSLEITTLARDQLSERAERDNERERREASESREVKVREDEFRQQQRQTGRDR
ncbi:MAG: Ti-type conjugative transfer relaxase TraA [Steroidobacteraceae bacterium]